ncbi:hypothetical protein BDW60DRAFT_220752 [Aspergillus nidulans var. acristatus]
MPVIVKLFQSSGTVPTGPIISNGFNIARYRKAGEPEIATWDYTSDQGKEPAIEDLELEECRKNGLEMDFSSDPYECDSEYESADAMSVSGDEEGNEENNDRKACEDFLSRTIYQSRQIRRELIGAFAYSTATKMDTLVPISSGELPDNNIPEDLEHLPGAACEMRGCRTAQFLVHKSCAQDWFLSGVCGGMISRDLGYPTVWPARGGLETVQSDTVNFDPEHINSNEISMPFHPWCFDIFSRQFKALFYKVNVLGLMKWRNAECSYEVFHEFSRTADVLEAQEQFWHAAEDGTTDYETAPASTSPTLTNRPASLPLDIRLHIIDFLDPADIARPHAVSKTFARLPNIYRVDGTVEHLLPRLNLQEKSIKVTKAGTNWHRVYATIKRNWACLKGLHNRQRIWEDVAEIIRRIQKYEGQ